MQLHVKLISFLGTRLSDPAHRLLISPNCKLYCNSSCDRFAFPRRWQVARIRQILTGKSNFYRAQNHFDFTKNTFPKLFPAWQMKLLLSRIKFLNLWKFTCVDESFSFPAGFRNNYVIWVAYTSRFFDFNALGIRLKRLSKTLSVLTWNNNSEKTGVFAYLLMSDFSRGNSRLNERDD